MKGINPIATQIANSPAAKLAAKLADNPMVKAATQMANNPMAKAATRISRIAQPYAEALQKFSHIEWIGKIPKHWELANYRRVFSRRKEYDDNPNKQVLSLTIEGVKEKNESFGKMAEDFTGHQIVRANDLVFTPRDFDATPILSGIAPCDGCISNLYFVLYPRTEDVNVKFYNYFMWGVKWGGDIWKRLSYGMRFSYNYGQFCALPTVKIPLEEQQAIADYLDGECARIDGIVTTQRQIIERLKEYKKSVITEAVTRGLNPDAPMKDSGIEWIGKIPEHWEVRRIKTLGEYRNGLTYNPENMVDESSGTLVLRSSNIQNGKIVLDDNVFVNTIIPEQLLVHKGDIIICSRNGSRELVGKNALIKEDILASFGAFMMIFRTNYPEYISYILNSAIFSYYLSTFFTATINQLTGSNFGNMQIVFCPDLNEQQEIIDYLDKECARIDTIIEKRERMIKLMTEYKKSLIYECVTGKKEIVDVVE